MLNTQWHFGLKREKQWKYSLTCYSLMSCFSSSNIITPINFNHHDLVSFSFKYCHHHYRHQDRYPERKFYFILSGRKETIKIRCRIVTFFVYVARMVMYFLHLGILKKVQEYITRRKKIRKTRKDKHERRKKRDERDKEYHNLQVISGVVKIH